MPGSATSRGQPLFSPHRALRQLCPSPSLRVPPSLSIREALLELDAARADALMVVDPASGLPLGIVTLRDVLRRIAIEACDLDGPIALVMTSGLITLPADASAHQASVLMVRRGVSHLVLTEADGRCFNLVSEADLYALPGAGVATLVADILAAREIRTLSVLAAGVRRYAARLLAEHVGAESICQCISSLNDLLTLQVIEVSAAVRELPYVPWCWLVFGSEGRLEQTLVTDQDNGLMFVAASAAEASDLRRAFLPFAVAVNQALAACGFPLCQGGIMAGNPAWCLSQDEWQSLFDGWMREAQPEALLNATIFFDFRVLYGQESLAGTLREWLRERAPDHPLFLRALVENTLNWPSPLTWWQGIRCDGRQALAHTLDLKRHGARPFVDAARIDALAAGVPETNTVERLRAVAGLRGRPAYETAALVDAFHQIQRLRLEHQLDATIDEPNRVNPKRLHSLDRQILKESLKQARSLQQRLAREYRVG